MKNLEAQFEIFKSERPRIPLNLTLFGDDGGDSGTDGDDGKGDGNPNDDGADDGDGGDKKPEITPEVQAVIDAAVAKEKGRLKRQFEKDKKEAVDKAAMLASLSEDERKRAEEADRIADLEKREKEIQYKEYKLEAASQLKEHDLSAEFADMVLAEEPEQTVKNIKALRAQIDAEVEAEVKKRLAGKPPAAGTGSTAVSTGEQMAKARNEEKKPQGIDPWK